MMHYKKFDDFFMIYILFNQSTYGNNNENDQVLDSFKVLYHIYIFFEGMPILQKTTEW